MFQCRRCRKYFDSLMGNYCAKCYDETKLNQNMIDIMREIVRLDDENKLLREAIDKLKKE